jgi:hypothetical protein
MPHVLPAAAMALSLQGDWPLTRHHEQGIIAA